MNCWEFMKCGREEDGRKVDELGVCPAYPYDGQCCANVAGTFCDLVQALRAVEHSGCQECPFYNSMHFDKSARMANQGKGL
jgi:hypothetical protein